MEAYLDTSEFLPDFIVRMSTVRTRLDKYIAQVKTWTSSRQNKQKCEDDILKLMSAGLFSHFCVLLLFLYCQSKFALRGAGPVKSMVFGFFGPPPRKKKWSPPPLRNLAQIASSLSYHLEMFPKELRMKN